MNKEQLAQWLSIILAGGFLAFFYDFAYLFSYLFSIDREGYIILPVLYLILTGGILWLFYMLCLFFYEMILDKGKNLK